MPLNPNKVIKKYYSISEVAEMFDLTETALRFWEKEFPTIKPKKSGRNVRQYSVEDIEEVRLVHSLVKVRGMKLAAARDAIKKSRSESLSTAEVIERLTAIREELAAMRRELDELV